MAEWYTVADETAQQRVLAAWPAAPIENLEVCKLILGVAREQVEAYAPAAELGYTIVDGVIVPAATVPDRFVYAQLRWAMSIYDAGRGELGPDGFTYTPRILDREVKRIIRPASGAPHVL